MTAAVIVGGVFAYENKANQGEPSGESEGTRVSTRGKQWPDGLQIYRNETFRFQLQYPNSWVIHSVREPDLFDFRDPGHTYYFEGGEEDPIQVLIYQNIGGWDTKMFANSAYNLPFSPDDSAHRKKIQFADTDIIAIENSFPFPKYEVVLPNVIIRISPLVADQEILEIAKIIASTVSPN